MGRPFLNEKEKDRRFYSGPVRREYIIWELQKVAYQANGQAGLVTASCLSVQFTVTGDTEMSMVCMLWWCRRVRRLNQVEFWVWIERTVYMVENSEDVLIGHMGPEHWGHKSVQCEFLWTIILILDMIFLILLNLLNLWTAVSNIGNLWTHTLICYNIRISGGG